MQLNYEYYLLESLFDMYICLKRNTVFITVPAYDVYDKACVWVIYENDKILFSYDKYKIVIKKDEKCLEVYMWDIFTKESLKVDLKTIDNAEYENAISNINRNKLLQINYGESIKRNVQYQYLWRKDIYEIVQNKIDFSGCEREIELIKNIVHWFMLAIKHDGRKACEIRKENIKEYLKAMDERINELNCRDMAYVLNAIFLGFCFKSRCIECKQYEVNVNNSHFMVEVYMIDERKWIAIDSSYGILFQDTQDNFLSIQELRKFLADNVPIKFVYMGKKISSILYIKALKKILFRFYREFIWRGKTCIEEKKLELTPVINDERIGDTFITDSEEVFWGL